MYVYILYIYYRCSGKYEYERFKYSELIFLEKSHTRNCVALVH